MLTGEGGESCYGPVGAEDVSQMDGGLGGWSEGAWHDCGGLEGFLGRNLGYDSGYCEGKQN